MAESANNKQGGAGKGKPAGKPPQNGKPGGKQAQSGKAVAKRADTKPARKGQQKAKAPARGKGGDRRGLMRFLRDVRIELGKVTWPTRKDLIQSTIVVLVAVGIATLYTGALDFVFSKTVDVILSVIK